MTEQMFTVYNYKSGPIADKPSSSSYFGASQKEIKKSVLVYKYNLTCSSSGRINM